jgi:hypothetical protein
MENLGKAWGLMTTDIGKCKFSVLAAGKEGNFEELNLLNYPIAVFPLSQPVCTLNGKIHPEFIKKLLIIDREMGQELLDYIKEIKSINEEESYFYRRYDCLIQNTDNKYGNISLPVTVYAISDELYSYLTLKRL